MCEWLRLQATTLPLGIWPGTWQKPQVVHVNFCERLTVQHWQPYQTWCRSDVAGRGKADGRCAKECLMM